MKYNRAAVAAKPICVSLLPQLYSFYSFPQPHVPLGPRASAAALTARGARAAFRHYRGSVLIGYKFL